MKEKVWFPTANKHSNDVKDNTTLFVISCVYKAEKKILKIIWFDLKEILMWWNGTKISCNKNNNKTKTRQVVLFVSNQVTQYFSSIFPIVN